MSAIALAKAEVRRKPVRQGLPAFAEATAGLSSLGAVGRAEDGALPHHLNDMPLNAGDRLGPYEITGELGAGGMGIVYRARDTKLDRDVALKVLPEPFTSDPDRLARFKREAQILASLNHPNIGSIYGLEEADGVRALVLELVEGPTLADRISKRPIALDEALPIAKQIAEALEAAHEAGVIHRDLKPANIKVRADSTVKVLDFGLAKVRAGPDLSQASTVTAKATATGVVLGTVPYMSPEQTRGQEVDRRTDIWAFGCVLYELLTGTRAFPGETRSDTIAAVLGRTPDWLKLPAEVPDSVRVLLRRTLERDPKRRLRDVGDARLELDDAVATGHGDAAAPAARLDRTGARPSGRRMLLASLTALAGVLLVGAGAWYLNTPDGAWRNPLADAQFTRLTDFEGAEEAVAISRDGQFVAFLSDQGGTLDAWIGQIGRGDFHNLTDSRRLGLGNLRTRNIRFAPDGASVSLWVRDQGSVRQWTVPTLGGLVRPWLDGVAELDWSPDGTRIAYHTNEPGDPIYVTEPNERVGRPIFTAASGLHNHFPVWSPEGAFIYFVHGFVQPDEMDVWRIRPSGGDPERLTFHDSQVAYPVFLDARTLLYLTTAADGSGPWLYAMDVERLTSHRVSIGVQRYTALAASADGQRIVATVASSSANLWRVPIGEDTVGESAARRIGLPTTRGVSPRLGPDFMVYLSSRGGRDGLWKAADDTVIELWSGSDGRVIDGPAIAPDGRSIAFTVQRRGQTRLYLMNEDGTGVRPLAESLDVRGAPAWSPDGRWITVAADLGSGPRLFAIPPDGGSPKPMVEEYSINPAWSPDGTFLVYAGEEVGPTFPVRAVADDGSPHPLPELILTRGARFAFLPGGDALVVLKGEVRNRNFSLVDLRTGDEQALTDFASDYTIRDFDVSSDGREIVFDRISEASDVILIEMPER